MKKSIYILVVLLFSAVFDLKAQPPDPGGGGVDNKPGCYPPPCVPIDGGLSWLLLAGTVYGGKKVFDLNKEEEKID